MTKGTCGGRPTPPSAVRAPVVAVAAVIALAASAPWCGSTPQRPAAPSGETFTAADGTRFAVETFVTNLEVPWALAFAPDGRLFVTERPGRVRVVDGGQMLEQPALTLTDVYAQGEAGVLGLALHPDFARNHYVYLVYTASGSSGPVNRLVRYTESLNRLSAPQVLLDNIPAAAIHDGSRLKFGPDRLLYMTMGDAANAPVAQDVTALNGKILRLNDDGSVPADNPFGSPVYSYGHRNPQGIDWDPATGVLWETEHGPTANDEVNVIDAGGNYGWPEIQGGETRPGLLAPGLFFTQTVAPSGAAFYRGTRLPGFNGDLFFAALAGRHLHRVRLDASDRRRVATDERLVDGRYGRLRDVVLGPDALLYVCTNNRDGRGTPGPGDDRILRIVPSPSETITVAPATGRAIIRR